MFKNITIIKKHMHKTQIAWNMQDKALEDQTGSD